MFNKHLTQKSIVIILTFLLSANVVFSQNETAALAEKMFIRQLNALNDGDYQRLVRYGNNAFREMMDEFLFDTLKISSGMQLGKGYQLSYLGVIERIGMQEHLWKLSINGEKYDLLGSLSISHGKVAGFHLD